MFRRAALIIALSAVLAPVSSGFGGERIVAAVAADNASGDVQIRYRDGSVVTAPKIRGERSLDRPAVAADRRTVGWLGNYDNCCQSYPIPRELVIWRAGRIVRRIPAEAMI